MTFIAWVLDCLWYAGAAAVFGASIMSVVAVLVLFGGVLSRLLDRFAPPSVPGQPDAD